MTPERCAQFQLAMEFVLDCIEGGEYFQHCPPEMVMRASRILRQAPAEVIIPPSMLHREPVVVP